MKSKRFTINITVLCIVFLFPYIEVKAARPLTTDDAETVETGMFEMEFGYDLSRNNGNSLNHSLNISLKHGFSNRIDFGIAFPYEIRPEKGLGNGEIQIKIAMLREKEMIPAVSSTFTFLFGRSEYFINGIATKEVGIFNIHSNIGYLATGTIWKNGITTYSGAIEVPAYKKLTLVAEIVGAYFDEENSLEWLVGGKFQVFEILILDAAFGKCFSKTNQEWKATLGLTYSF